jgi:CheY-like chemotaxis protein
METVMSETSPSQLLVLVVDDSHDCAYSLALLMRVWGHEAVVAYDGPSALEAASARPPDVVLLDIAMPGMDGCELTRRLRQMPGMEKALLVAITGHGREAEVRRCEEAGIDCYFLKPVDPLELQQVLVRAERLGRERRQLACSSLWPDTACTTGDSG